ncbi:outer membrane lipoprotein carrier protein LolA [Denitrovibrio acetiphilus DSM 12809]|uniref:Outer membrane lipoprotein carrier protein LolA n=1 Tax=Denitrovibrio acetiphilus (strain DSM 12809 / NBRC 114555 / N2460) TaxID=522772 RepID=D4H3I9_DENA2|nr:outer-membrane lipoprotein carrier protein LolA [Denitrovibrio acetiphilus]ADD69091.1 outer membrane lipoprotein carrier protein LolA [Denitrovibrio acetiphilus DSM 12809]
MKKLILTYMVLMLTFFVAHSRTAEEVVAALSTVQSYTADFVQSTEIEGFGEDVYSGKIFINISKQAMWDYSKPYRQFYLFDKDSMNYYDSETKQLIVQKLDPSANVFMRLMLNPADIRKDFDVSFENGRLTLSPIGDIGLSTIVFTVENDTVKGISTKDQNGNNTSVEFKNIKKDIAIPSSVFKPVIPEETEVFRYN